MFFAKLQSLDLNFFNHRQVYRHNEMMIWDNTYADAAF
jgi:hypothetical protein